MNETRDALNALKRDTGIDYTHADPETQEEQANLYLEFVRQQQAGQPKSAERKAEEHDQHVVDVHNRYRRNGWNMPNEYEGIDWDRLMSVQEAADALGVNRQRVHQLLDTGKLDGRKVGGTWVLDRASVEERKAQA